MYAIDGAGHSATTTHQCYKQKQSMARNESYDSQQPLLVNPTGREGNCVHFQLHGQQQGEALPVRHLTPLFKNVFLLN